MLPGVSQMQALVFRDGELVVVAEPGKDEPVVYGGYDDERNFVGYAMPGAGPGFQDTIALLYGYKPGEKIVVGMEILESRETPGLGDKIYKDAEWVGGFAALAIEPEIVARQERHEEPTERDRCDYGRDNLLQGCRQDYQRNTHGVGGAVATDGIRTRTRRV